jgi:hypothetical protein
VDFELKALETDVEQAKNNRWMKSSIFYGIIPCSLVKVKRRFGGTEPLALPAACFLVVSCLA